MNEIRLSIHRVKNEYDYLQVNFTVEMCEAINLEPTDLIEWTISGDTLVMEVTQDVDTGQRLCKNGIALQLHIPQSKLDFPLNRGKVSKMVGFDVDGESMIINIPRDFHHVEKGFHLLKRTRQKGFDLLNRNAA